MNLSHHSRSLAALRAIGWLLLFLVAALPAWGRPLPDASAWPHEQSDLPPDPTVVWGRLNNGVRYVLMPNHTPKDRVSMRLMVAAGSLMETDDQRGLAHFLEHMAFKGSRNLPAGDLVQYLERLGMSFGADTNAHTSFDETVYQLELPSNDPALVDKSLMVMRETADRLLLLAPEMEKERGVVLSEERLRDTPDYRATVANLEFLLPESLVPRRFPIGVDAVISGAPRQRMVDYYQTWYRPERLTLVVVGAIQPKELEAEIAKHFDSMRTIAPARPNPDIGTILPRAPAARLYSDPDAHTEVMLQVVAPADDKAETRTSRERDTALYLANGVISRRLASLALKGNAPFMQGSAQVNDMLRFARIGAIVMQCKPEDWKAALSIAEQELRRALKYGFTTAELEEQKKNLRSMIEQQVRSASTRESSELASDVVEHLSSFDVFTAPEYDLAELDRTLPAITPERAQAELRELWGDGGQLAFVSGPIALQHPEAEILAVLNQSQAQPVTPPHDGELQNFAYTDFGRPGTVVERKVAPALDVIQIRFGNNVRLNLKPTKFDANTVLVGIRFGGGRLDLARDKPGLKLLAEGAFLPGGLALHSLDQLNGITAGHNVSLDFTVDDDAFLFTGRTTPEDLPLQLQVMAAYLTAPGYRTEALERFRDGLGPMYLSLTRTPRGVLQSQVARFVHGGDPRFGVPDRDEVAKQTVADLKSWLAEPLATSYLEISIVGDFDVNAALAAVSSTFGALPTRQAVKPPYTEQRQVHFPSQRTMETFPFRSQDPKAYAAVYWPTTDFSHISEIRRLFVLAEVLEGRILDRIRVREGMSYTAQASHAPSLAFPGYGVLFALVDATPSKATPLALEIRDIAADIARNGITQDELDRARNPIVNGLRKRLADNQYILSALVIASQEDPERLTRITTAVKELESMTVEDVNAVARKYLQPEAALPIIVVPSKNAQKTPQARPASRTRTLAFAD